jgi:hypothetical protein
LVFQSAQQVCFAAGHVVKLTQFILRESGDSLMEPEFVNQYTITLELLKEWAKHPVGRSAVSNRKKSVTLRTLGIAISGMMIAAGIIMNQFYVILMGIAFFLIYAFRLFVLPNKALKAQYDMKLKSLNNMPWIRTTTFSNMITVEDGKSNTSFEYSKILKITENEQYFNLYLNENMVLRIRRDSFILGTCDDFEKFIKKSAKRKKKK